MFLSLLCGVGLQKGTVCPLDIAYYTAGKLKWETAQPCNHTLYIYYKIIIGAEYLLLCPVQKQEN